mmetsp:Transcript_8272/g.15077  ORF Transcript_8272/g.15077 Transcript_8272/m.15077 type:complete len:254 (+) Transcript_8272:1813-2574(+)
MRFPTLTTEGQTAEKMRSRQCRLQHLINNVPLPPPPEQRPRECRRTFMPGLVALAPTPPREIRQPLLQGRNRWYRCQHRKWNSNDASPRTPLCPRGRLEGVLPQRISSVPSRILRGRQQQHPWEREEEEGRQVLVEHQEGVGIITELNNPTLRKTRTPSPSGSDWTRMKRSAWRLRPIKLSRRAWGIGEGRHRSSPQRGAWEEEGLGAQVAVLLLKVVPVAVGLPSVQLLPALQRRRSRAAKWIQSGRSTRIW